MAAAVDSAAARGELADATGTGAVADMLYAVLLGASFYGRFAPETEHDVVIGRLRGLLSRAFDG